MANTRTIATNTGKALEEISRLPKSDPTEDEIREACAAIQLTWTARERKLRRHRATHLDWQRDPPMAIQVIDTSALGGVQGVDY